MMNILEVREGFIKFEVSKKVSLSSFIQINDALKSYIAQVVLVKKAGERNIVYAKILFLYNGMLQPYDNSAPSQNSEILEFEFDNISQIFESKNSVTLGTFIDTDCDININKDVFDKGALICIDSPEHIEQFISNVSLQFEQSVIIDTTGHFDCPKYIAGTDFNLPLNTDALEFLYEDCLNDATSESKDLIKEIFQELSDYSKTVPFLPFGTLKSIVDDMVEKSHIFKLLVLKNKLAKFDKMKYFAQTAKESENLDQILSQKHVVIDLSGLDTIFLNRYLTVIYAALEKQNPNTQLFVNASNSVDKRNLKKLFMGKLSVTFATHSGFKYLNEIKSFFETYIVEPSFNANNIFKAHAMLLNAMNKSNFLVVGKGTENIPIIFNLKDKIEETETCKVESRPVYRYSDR